MTYDWKIVNIFERKSSTNISFTDNNSITADPMMWTHNSRLGMFPYNFSLQELYQGRYKEFWPFHKEYIIYILSSEY